MLAPMCILAVCASATPSTLPTVGGNTSFDIDVSEALHYVCHFG
jgi:uncharacterized protein YaiE (UPF0345 family)